MENYQNGTHLVTTRQNKKSFHDNRYQGQNPKRIIKDKSTGWLETNDISWLKYSQASLFDTVFSTQRKQGTLLFPTFILSWLLYARRNNIFKTIVYILLLSSHPMSYLMLGFHENEKHRDLLRNHHLIQDDHAS